MGYYVFVLWRQGWSKQTKRGGNDLHPAGHPLKIVAQQQSVSISGFSVYHYSNLVVRCGKPDQVVDDLIRQLGSVTAVAFHEEVCTKLLHCSLTQT